jgi:hypothetical protein
MRNSKVTRVKKSIVGKSVPTNIGGHSGRAIEDMFANEGFNIDKHGILDMPLEGIEIKSRDEDAVSPHTTGSQTMREIIKKDWEHSPLRDKLQQQLRVFTKDGIIVRQELWDLTDSTTQANFKDAYETARAKMIAGDISNTIAGNKWGYFEKVPDTQDSYIFRHSKGSMEKIEKIMNSTFNDLFDEV